MRIAIIPARGGSKRIPRKNIRSFHGMPIIAYSIQAAIDSKLFDHVMVSTDDQEIADIAVKYGATVPFFRSEETSDDRATTIDVIQEVLMKYQRQGISFETLCCIYPCSPFVNPKVLAESLIKLEDGGYNAVYPVIRYAAQIQRALKIEKNSLEVINPEAWNTRSQDLSPAFYDAGMFYWFKTKTITDGKTIKNGNCSFIELSELETQDIDDESDWTLAELKFKLFKDGFSE